MRPDYRLTEKDALFNLLTPEEIQQLKQNKLAAKSEYNVFHAQPRDLKLNHRANTIRENLARQAGFDGFAHDGVGDCVTDWTGQDAHPDEKTQAKLQEYHRLLQESPEYAEVQHSRKLAAQEDAQTEKQLEQKMYYEALRMAIPRIDGKLKPDARTVRLTPNDVHSVLLTPRERSEVEATHKNAINELFENVFKPLYNKYQKQKDALLDKIARQAGFAQFDENEAGTGLRNYTALKKPMNDIIKEQVEKFHRIYEESKKKGEVKEYNRLSKNLSDWDFHMKSQFGQVLLRNILDKTNPRLTRVDAAGKPILTPEAFLEHKNSVHDNNEIHLFEEPYTAEVKVKDGDNERTFKADKGIAPVLQQINDAGYVTGQSCSGLLEDHPNYRYVQDDEQGRYVNGECINFNKQGSGTYLTFYKPKEGMDGLNVQQQIDNIREVAKEKNWVVEDMEVFGMPSVRLGLPLTYDGTGKRELLHEVNETVDRDFPGLYEKDFMKWLKIRNSRETEFHERHGGVVRWTDDMIKAQHKMLAQALVNAEKQRRDMERISDVRIYVGGDGHYRIKCRIDNEEMLSEHLSDVNVDLLNKGTDEKLLAYRCYENYFQQEQQSQSMKR